MAGSPQSTTSVPARRPDVEGLRGIAVLLVVAFHAGVSWLRGGFVAVDVFFFLSGYFLTTALMRQVVTGDEIDLTRTYARRVWRLLPMLAIVLVATLASLALYAPIDRAAIAAQLTGAAYFASNIAFAAGGTNYFHAGENPLLQTWTLGVEYQLAIVFPALVVFAAGIGRRRAESVTSDERRVAIVTTVFKAILTAGVISLALSLWLSESSPAWAYFGPHTRLWTFCAGPLMAFFTGGGQSVVGTSHWRIGFAQLGGLALLLIPAWLYDRTLAYPGIIALVPVGGALLLLAGGSQAAGTLVGRALGSRPLTWLGRRSYAWYLWHWPCMVLGTVLIPGIGPVGKLGFGVSGLVLAELSMRFFENPARELIVPRVMQRSPLLWASGVSASIAVLGGLVAVASNAHVHGSVHRVFAAARDDRMHHGCWVRSVDDTPAGACDFGATRASTTIALMGDSHAEHWLGALERAGQERGWRVQVNVMGGCPVSNFSGLLGGALSRRYDGCNRFREATLDRIVAEKPSAVILSSYDDYMESPGDERREYAVSSEAWLAGLRRTYSRLSAAGIPVIVIRGTPKVPFDVPSCLSRRAANLPFAGDCTYSLDADFISRARRAQDVAALGLNVRFVDMNDVVCDANPCDTMRDGVVRFTDTNHLTASFSRSMGGALGARIAAALDAPSPSLLRKAVDLLKEHGPRILIEQTIERVMPGR